jgi:Ubiquinol-cytochrome C reductase, UQCRX/QCR9 like
MAAREATMSGFAGLRSTIYNVFLRRTSVYVTVSVAAAYASTEAYLGMTDRVWNSINKGVCSHVSPLQAQSLNFSLLFDGRLGVGLTIFFFEMAWLNVFSLVFPLPHRNHSLKFWQLFLPKNKMRTKLNFDMFLLGGQFACQPASPCRQRVLNRGGTLSLARYCSGMSSCSHDPVSAIYGSQSCQLCS